MDIHRRLSVDPNAYSGASADVFEIDGNAYKLFRVFGVARTAQQVRDLFESECEAYTRASVDAWLRQHTAAFHGPCVIENVIDRHGNSVRSLYALDCCYGIELLVGRESKLYADGLRQSLEHLREAQERFSMNGIDVRDSSVFNYEYPEDFKFIDFRLEHCL